MTERPRLESTGGTPAIALAAVLFALVGVCLFIADLGERQHLSRLAIELALFVPLIFWWLTRHIRSRV